MSTTSRPLADRLDSYPEAWRPQPGDKLIGEVVALDVRDGYSGKPYPVVVVLDDDAGKELAFHAFHDVPRRELAAQRPQVGERIGVLYRGKPAGQSYEGYRLIVDRAGGQDRLDWSRFADDDGEPEPVTSDVPAEPPAATDPEPPAGGDADIPF